MGSIFNSRGMGLAQVIVATAIMGIVMAGFTSYMVSAQRQQAHISMKIDMNDFRGQIAQTLSNGQNCKIMMNGFSYNAGATPPSSYDNNINTVVNLSNPLNVQTIATKGQKVPISPLLKVNDISVQNIKDNGGNLSAELVFDVQPIDNSAIKLKPIRFTDMNIATQVVGANRVVSSCTAGQTFLQGGGNSGTNFTCLYGRGTIGFANGQYICDEPCTSSDANKTNPILGTCKPYKIYKKLTPDTKPSICNLSKCGNDYAYPRADAASLVTCYLQLGPKSELFMDFANMLVENTVTFEGKKRMADGVCHYDFNGVPASFEIKSIDHFKNCGKINGTPGLSSGTHDHRHQYSSITCVSATDYKWTNDGYSCPKWADACK